MLVLVGEPPALTSHGRDVRFDIRLLRVDEVMWSNRIRPHLERRSRFGEKMPSPEPLPGGHASSTGFVAVPIAISTNAPVHPASPADSVRATIYELAYEAALARVIARRIRSARFSVN